MAANALPDDHRYVRKKPCQECPFNKTLPTPFSGGSPPEVYIGQICGPFLLSCHMDPEYDPGPENLGQLTITQCAGAAIFRANVGVADFMPPNLHHLPADTENVDATFVEFMARQLGVSLEEAQARLDQTSPLELLKIELRRVGIDPETGKISDPNLAKKKVHFVPREHK